MHWLIRPPFVCRAPQPATLTHPADTPYVPSRCQHMSAVAPGPPLPGPPLPGQAASQTRGRGHSADNDNNSWSGSEDSAGCSHCDEEHGCPHCGNQQYDTRNPDFIDPTRTHSDVRFRCSCGSFSCWEDVKRKRAREITRDRREWLRRHCSECERESDDAICYSCARFIVEGPVTESDSDGMF